MAWRRLWWVSPLLLLSSVLASLHCTPFDEVILYESSVFVPDRGKPQIFTDSLSQVGPTARAFVPPIARDRHTRTTDSVRERADTQAIRSVLEPIVDAHTVLCSDSSAIYRAFAKRVHLVQKLVNLNAGIRTIDHALPFQNIDAYDNHLKIWMVHFHGVATKSLPNYFGWRRGLECIAETLTPALFLAQAIEGDQHLYSRSL